MMIWTSGRLIRNTNNISSLIPTGSNSSSYRDGRELPRLSHLFSVLLFGLLVGVTDAQTEPIIRDVGSSYGFREHRPGMWSYLNPEIVNPTDIDQQLEVVAFFGIAQNRKFGKKITVPARTTLRTTLPLRLPDVEEIPLREGTDRPIEILTVQLHLYDVKEGRSRLILNKGKRSFDTDIGLRGGNLPSRQAKYRATAMLEGSPRQLPSVLNRGDNEPDSDAVDDFVTSARIRFNQIGRIGKSKDGFLPETGRALESIDQLIIDNDYLLDDVAGLESVRRWLARGGHIWLHLDRVSENTAQRLFGDDLPFQIIDRTSLNVVQVRDANPLSQVQDPPPQSFERPVNFVRVILNVGNLTHRNDGWPAAFWIPMGQGRVYVTTLDPRAWIREFDAQIDQASDPRLGIAKYALTEPMQQIAYEMYAEEKPQPVLDFPSIKANLIDQVGYQVLSRQKVLLVLGSYIVLLVGIGVALMRVGHLEKLVFIGPGLALVAALLFLGIGNSSRSAVEPSVTSFQLVRPIAGSDELQIDGMTVVYTPEGKDYQLNAGRDGKLDLDGERSVSQEEKISWDRQGRWKLENGKLEPGLVTYRVQSNVKNEDPLEATAKFDANGLTGSFRIRAGDQKVVDNFEDLILALPNGKFLSARLEKGQFQLDSSDLLAPNEFIRSNFVDDRQRWHQEIYRKLFPADEWKRRPAAPTMFGWGAPLEMDIEFPEELKRTGGALFRIPFRIEKTQPGVEVNIPGELVGLENVTNRDGAISAAFDNQTGNWIGSIAPQSIARLRFQIPPQVLPLEPEGFKLTIGSIDGRNRIIELGKMTGSELTVLKSLDDYQGSLELEITDSSILQLDRQGGFNLEVEVRVKPEFYERQKQLAQDRSNGRKVEKLDLNRETMSGISLSVFGKTKQ